MVPASQELQNFWNAFKNYSSPIETNKVIQLPENVYILGNFSIGSSIFIRPCYPELLKTTLSIIESSLNLIILGNPGIGKTYFGYFLLLYLASCGATIVYQCIFQKEIKYLFTPQNVFVGSGSDFYNQLSSSSTFYIADGIEPDFYPAKTILISSHRNEVWKRFAKNSCTLRYMPVWSKEELFFCRSLLFSLLSEELVGQLYSMWGGIARYVLKYAKDDGQQALLKSALDISNIDSVLECFGGTGKKADASSRLIHRTVLDGFHAGPFKFASEYVADEIYKGVYLKDRDHLVRFLSASQGNSDIGPLRGTLFERHAHTIISKGGNFMIRNLKTGLESELMLPLNYTIFPYSSNDQAFQEANNRYFLPVSKIFESVDSFIKPNLLFQMTGAKEHPCKQTGLRDVLNLLGNPIEAKLYFVVPPDRFASFKFQSYHGTGGKVLHQRYIIANVKKLSQYVLTYKFSSQ